MVAAAAARAGFWRATTADELRQRVRVANAAVVRANINLIESDRLPLFDAAEVETTWCRLRR